MGKSPRKTTGTRSNKETWIRSPTSLIVAGLLIHAFFLAALSGDWLRPFFNDASHTRRGFDFGVFYLAGQALAEGRDIYSLQGAFGYRYLPAFALVFGRFFALFQPLTAYLIHLVCTELFLAANLWLTWQWIAAPRRRAVALFMWLAFSPYFLELYMGQVSFWAASLCFWLLIGLERGQGRYTALYWAGALLVKPNALILVPALLRLRALRVLGLGLLIALLSSLPYFLLYPDGFAAFVDKNLHGGHIKGALTHAGNLGLQAGLVSTVAKLADLPLSELTTLDDLPPLGRAIIYLSQAIILLATLVTTFRQRTARPLSLLSLWLCTFFLVYKDVWEHHYVFLLPVLIALYAQSESPKLLWVYAFIALPTPFILFDVASGSYGPIDPEREWGSGISLLYRSAKLIPTSCLWLWLYQGRFAKATI